MRVMVSTHPRTRKIKNFKKFKFNKIVDFHKPFGFFDYINLQRNAYCTISDSGTITEEASLLNFPAITIRNSHERPEGMDEGGYNVRLTKRKSLFAIEITVNSIKSRLNKFDILDYKNQHVSDQVSKIIFSYIEFINKNIWKK